MTKSTKLQYEFVRRFNRINSGVKRYISPPEIDSFLNEALLLFFENRVPLYKTSNLARKELGILEEKNKCFDVLDFDNRSSYFELPDNFYKLLRVEASIQCDTCPEIQARTTEILNHKISESLIDPNWKPSYNFAETFYELSDKKVITYHNNAFNITKVCVDFLRKPKFIATPSLSNNGSYINSSGEQISQDVDLEIDADRKIVDVAVWIASRDLTDLQEANSQISKIIQAETVYIS